MFHRGWKYFLAFENYFQICVFSFTIIFVFGFFNDCWCATPWQWQIGALAVFLAWFNVIILLKDMPWAGIPINMLFNIIWTFLKLIFMPILLIIAFSIPFYMLFVRNLAGVEVCFEYIQYCLYDYLEHFIVSIGRGSTRSASSILLSISFCGQNYHADCRRTGL